MPRSKNELPRKEEDCIKYIQKFLNKNKDKYKATFKIEKDTEEHFIPETGRCVISDAVIYDIYKVKVDDRFSRRHRRVISLEFEEHMKNYSILRDETKCPAIHVPLRKLHYFRPFNAQYWIKIDADGTPICIPYIYIANKSEDLNDIGAQGQFTSRYQTNMIKAAVRDPSGKFPDYVIIGWNDIFKEFKRILNAYDNKNVAKLMNWDLEN